MVLVISIMEVTRIISESITMSGVYYLRVAGTGAIGSYDVVVTGIGIGLVDGDGVFNIDKFNQGTNPLIKNAMNTIN